MGYRRGAPSWVYKNQLTSLSASYQQQISMLNQKIEQLQEENDELKKKVEELENELNQLRV